MIGLERLLEIYKKMINNDEYGSPTFKEVDEFHLYKDKIEKALEFYEKFYENPNWIKNTTEFGRIMDENQELKQLIDDKKIYKLQQNQRTEQDRQNERKLKQIEDFVNDDDSYSLMDWNGFADTIKSFLKGDAK